jgi:hypothetical protein
MIPKACGRDGAARVAIDAGVVYVEFAFYVFREAVIELSHGRAVQGQCLMRKRFEDFALQPVYSPDCEGVNAADY